MVTKGVGKVIVNMLILFTVLLDDFLELMSSPFWINLGKILLLPNYALLDAHSFVALELLFK